MGKKNQLTPSTWTAVWTRVDRLSTKHPDLIAQKRRAFKIKLFDCRSHFLLFLFNKFFRIIRKVLLVDREKFLECPVVCGLQFFGNVFDLLVNTLGGNSMRTVIFDLYRPTAICRSEEHTSELQSHVNLVCRLLLEKK